MKNQKRKVSFEFLLFLSVLFATALTGCTRTAAIRKYYENVGLAESAILNNDMEVASQCYNKAFKTSVYPFYYDVNNALIVEVERGKDLDRIQAYSSLLIQYGVDLKNDTTSRIFHFLQSKDYFEKMRNVAFDFQPVSKDTSDLNALFTELRDSDQEVRRLSDRKNNGVTYHESFVDTIMYVDSIQQSKLLILLNRIDDDNRKYLTRSSYSTIDLLIGHSGQWHKFPCIDKYKSLVEKGLADNRDFAFTADEKKPTESYAEADSLISQSGPYGTLLGYVIGEYFFICRGNTPYFKFDLETINKNREAIYLEDIYDSLEKNSWRVLCADKPYIFLPYSRFPAEENIQQTIENIKQKQLPVDIYGPSDCMELERVIR
jgi:hypothetical protein